MPTRSAIVSLTLAIGLSLSPAVVAVSPALGDGRPAPTSALLSTSSLQPSPQPPTGTRLPTAPMPHTRQAVPPGTHLSYTGGPALANAIIVDVYWGSPADSSYPTTMRQLWNDFITAGYFDWLQQYPSNYNHIIGRPFLPSAEYIITTRNGSPALSESDIAADLNYQIFNGHPALG